jgi:GNAT superfamily N-acetyltransferase
MQLIEVTNKKTGKDFLDVPRVLYKNDPYWVCPLDNEINKIFDPGHNPYYKEGDAIRWVLEDDQGNLIGRVAAFYNLKRSHAYDQPTGGLGFFEAIEDQEAAFKLFDAAKEWLQERGMEAMDGSINFGENQNHWGVLVEGFMHPGIGMPYNFPYYHKFFEAYGFRSFFEQYTYHRHIDDVFPERFKRISEWVAQKPGYSFRHFRFKEQEKFIHDLVTVYNEAWSQFKEDFTPLDPDELRVTLNDAKMIIDEKIIWFAYHEEKPIAFFILFPDVNQILRHLNGKLTPWNIIKFLYYKKRNEMTRIRALVAGVSPKFQNSGIESAIFKYIFEALQERPYKEIEMSWVGDFNKKMQALYKNVGGKPAKKHITYRYMFNPDAPFRRFMDTPLGKLHGGEKETS